VTSYLHGEEGVSNIILLKNGPEKDRGGENSWMDLDGLEVTKYHSSKKE